MKSAKLMCVVILTLLTAAPAALATNRWYVDGVNGNDNNNCQSPQTACKTIGHAISLASSGDSIMVAAATYVENLTIGSSLRIIGASTPTTIIDGGGVGTVVSILDNGGTNVTLQSLTIQNGYAVSGAGILNFANLMVDNCAIIANRAVKHSCNRFCAPNLGGGIYSRFGKLTVNRNTISGNTAREFGSAIFGFGVPVTISDSTISGNKGVDSIENTGGKMTISNSTISGNSGGGVVNYSHGRLTINNSTISGNNFGVNNISGRLTVATLQNTIVANMGRNCYGKTTSNGYNLSSDDSCNFKGPGDLNNTDPKLGTLGNYGGPTQTIPLLSGSPAIDAGNPNGCTDGNGKLLKTDQRGKPRPDKEDETGCDMGAYEKQSD